MRLIYSKRHRNAVRAGAALAGLTITAAFAFFFATLIGDAEHEGQTGKGPTEVLPVTLSFPDGLTPESPVEMTATLNNETAGTISLDTFEMELETPTVPACAENWLEAWAERVSNGEQHTTLQAVLDGTNEGTWGEYAPGTQNVFPTAAVKVWLRFDPSTTAVDQSSCEQAPVIARVHAETP